MVLFRLDAKDLYYIICAYIYTLFLVGCEGLISYTLTFIDSSIFCYTERTIFKIFYYICASCDACRLKFLQINAKIKHKLNGIINLLENKGGDKADPVEQNNNNLLPDFPLTTIQELNHFNEQLMQNDVQRQFVKKMSNIGGDTVSKTVRNVMSQTITDELAQIYTWTGQKNRLALKKTKISDVIIEAIMISINTTMAEVEGYMKEWVRRASDRIRSLSKK
ncbi:uncharacterized protein LOC120358535 [Solenopsis invicta]|uniref:uncharacterized protein LOC120358535 n=1 Tax=Solenopsis invicta TaxID=13686 RepID=UPI00193E77BB|nr:uncharacterized protein LOC120358535 [Solenopsis invicta]